jgi:hypothetical protein
MMLSLPFPTTRKPAALASSCGFPCVFNLTDKDFPNVDIYPIEIRATERSNQNLSTHRGSLGRAAVFANFRPRDAKALDYDDFTDRKPCDEPQRLDHVAAVADVGRRALGHWLREAARTDGEERKTALEIAREIAGMIDEPWEDLFSGEAA